MFTKDLAAAAEPLAGMLLVAAKEAHLVVGFDGTNPFVRQITKQFSKDVPQNLAFIGGFEHLSMTIRIGRSTEFRVKGAFQTMPQARQASVEAKSAVSSARQWLEQFTRLTPKEIEALDQPRLIRLARHLVRELKNATVNLDGQQVDVVRARKRGRAGVKTLSTTLPGATLELVRRVRNTATQARSQNNLKQLALAIWNFEGANGEFPPVAICDKDGKPLLSWRVAILPYIEQAALYKEFKLDEPWDGPNNKKLIAKMPKTYAMAGDVNSKGAELMDYPKYTADGLTFYQALSGKGAAFELIPSPLAQFKASGMKSAAFEDGTSFTLLLAEAADPVIWTKPSDLDYVPNKALPKFAAHHQGGVFYVAMADGSVRALKKTIDPKILKSLTHYQKRRRS